MVHGSIHGFVHSLVCGTWFMVSIVMFFLKMVLSLFFPLMSTLTDLLKLSLIMFYLNMVVYPVFLSLLSTLTWDTFLTLRGTWGYYLNQVVPLRPAKSWGWWRGWGCKILVSAPGPFGFWALGFWGQGLTILTLSKRLNLVRS